jgi:hypothetical protein
MWNTLLRTFTGRAITTASLCAVAASCSSSTSPASLAGTYTLELFGGHPLPTPGFPPLQIISGQLTVSADGSYTRTETYTYTGGSQEPTTSTEHGRISVSGTALTVTVSTPTGSPLVEDGQVLPNRIFIKGCVTLDPALVGCTYTR